jgi:hypothetical protein
MDKLNKCHRVRESCQRVADQAKEVSVSTEGVVNFAK